MRLLLIMIMVFFSYIGSRAEAVSVTDADRRLLLEIWLDGHTDHVIIPVIERNGSILIRQDKMRLAGIPCQLCSKAPPHLGDPDPLVDITALSGLKPILDEPNQRLLIITPRDQRRRQVFDMSSPSARAGRALAGKGFVLGYDALTTVPDGGGPVSAAATLSAMFFSRQSLLNATGYVRQTRGERRLVRFDTSLEFDHPETTRRWSVGDAVSGGLRWSRPVRFAGLQLATDYSLQPGLQTFPLPKFFGTTALPSTLDVFIDAARVLETPLKPGPFEISNLPVVTGGGQATIVTRDVLGRQTTETIPFYTSKALLKQGLMDYSLEAGAMRQAYGLQSFDYGQAMAMATLRYGLSDRLTLEGHSEFSGNAALAGGGISLGIFLGTLQASAAVSTSAGHMGGLASFAIESEIKPVNFFAACTVSSASYRDAAAVGGQLPPRRTLQIGSSVALGYGFLGMTWIADDDGAGNRVRLASASYSVSLGRGIYFGLTSVYERDGNKWSVQSFFSIPFGGRDAVSTSVSRDGRSVNAQISVSRAANPDGGLGYRLVRAIDNAGQTEADISWINKYTSLNAAVASNGDRKAARFGASGAVIFMDGSLFAARHPGDAFALVRTGAPNIRIYKENRLAAISDKKGEALLTGLTAYANNQISINPFDYPMNRVILENKHIVIPRRNSGTVVDLAPEITRPALLEVLLANGAYPPVGAPVMLKDVPEPQVVGRRGAVFIADLQAVVTGSIELPQGRCHFRVGPLAAGGSSIARIGPVVCRPEPVHVR